MSLLQMSLSGAVMIAAIVVIRALAMHRLPKNVFLLLWGIVLLRLLVPYSLPSAFSVYSLIGRAVPRAGAITDLPPVQFVPAAPAVNAAAAPAVPAVGQAAAPIDPWAVIWLLGALACAAFFAMAYRKCRREFKASLPVENAYAERWLREHSLHRPIQIRQSGSISAPLTYGVFHPVILMPKTVDWDDRDSLSYVLAHEYVHICRFDALTKLMLTAAFCVHWFNPAVWVMLALANRDMELSCDEAVIRRFGEGTKSAYAMTLIRMEEARSGLTLLSSSFSKNAIEERIIAIMKIKKTSFSSLFTAAALVIGMVFAFATTGQTAEAKGTGDHAVQGAAQSVVQDDTVLSYTVSPADPKERKTYYSWDGGETWTHMSEEEFKDRYTPSDVEWWTAEEYEAWLEKEKEELQSVIGDRAWTSSDGWFTWTQEKVDETIAMYEGILEDIKNGMLYGKTTDGGDLFGVIAGTSVAADSADMGIEVWEDVVTAADFSQYAPYGLAWDESENALYFKGQRVRYFLDGVELEGSGGTAIWLEYADAAFEGEIDVHTVRQRVQNADGSFDPMGPLTGLEEYSQAEYDMRTLCGEASLEAETCFEKITQEQQKKTQELLQAYAAFGLRWEFDPAEGELSMSWQEKPVHSVFDAEKGVWIANSMRGLDLGPDAVDLEAVYKRGKLTALRETEHPLIAETYAVGDMGTAAEPGTSFAERFEKYAPFGITYVEAEKASGAGNVYFNGRLVSRFADLDPEGGAFSFTSAKQGGISMRTLYDSGGRLAGVETVTD